MRFLSNKEKKQLQEKLPLHYTIDKKDEVKQKDDILYKNGEMYLIEQEGLYVPHLSHFNQEGYPYISVDKGAIPFVTKGADVMRPGIVEISDDVEKDQIIAIKAHDFNATIAIGKAMLASSDMKDTKTGKVVKVLHYLKDKYC